MSNEIERFYSEILSIKEILNNTSMPSDVVAFEAMAAKSLVLATGSYFEKAVRDLLITHIETMSSSVTLLSFLDKQALSRRFHTMFDWDRENINKFIRLFGKEFQEFVEPHLKKEKISSSIKEFIFICRMRNELVHNNFSEFPIEITFDEVKQKFDIALPLLEFLSQSLIQCEQACAKITGTEETVV